MGDLTLLQGEKRDPYPLILGREKARREKRDSKKRKKKRRFLSESREGEGKYSPSRGGGKKRRGETRSPPIRGKKGTSQTTSLEERKTKIFRSLKKNRKGQFGFWVPRKEKEKTLHFCRGGERQKHANEEAEKEHRTHRKRKKGGSATPSSQVGIKCSAVLYWKREKSGNSLWRGRRKKGEEEGKGIYWRGNSRRAKGEGERSTGKGKKKIHRGKNLKQQYL